MISSTWFIALGVGLLGVAGCLFGAFHALGRKRLLNDNPTSRTQGVFIGLTELNGTAEMEKPLISYLAQVPVVHYEYTVEEHWQRTVTETYRDAKGGIHTRTKTESGWKKVDSGGLSAPFYLKDDTGVLRILPEGAKIEDQEVFEKTVNSGDPLYFNKCPAREIAHTTHRRRFRETAIPLHARLYIVGRAREREDIVAAEIAQDKSAPLFLISTRTEKQVSKGYGARIWLWAVLGFLVSLGVAAAWQLMRVGATGFTLPPYLIAAFGYLFVYPLGWIWTVYNSFISLHNRVKRGWSQVDVQLKRRNDLIPNLVQAVEGYRDHEQATQLMISQMRTQLSATAPGLSGPDFSGLASTLKVAMEAYPHLRADSQFLKLQKSLIETEQRIALARDYYNDIATFYNSRLEMVPDRFIGAVARLKPRTLMSAADFERAPVPVNLNS